MKRFPLRSLALLVAISAAGERVQAQAMERKTSTAILRDQAAAIAEEILDSLRLAPASTGRVSISVRGAVFPDIVENAMLEGLQRRGFTGVLRQADVSGGSYSLHLLVLEQRAELEASKESAVGRNVRTTLEARVGEGDGTDRYLGKFFRIVTDTVAAREQAGGISDLSRESDSFLDRIIEPLVVVAGAFLIVYLFFTVRS